MKAYLAEGAKVAFSSTSQAKIDALMPELEGDVAGFVADMNKEEDIKNFVENAKEKFGTIDIVVPNAGYEGKAHPVQEMTLELFQQTYMLNVFSVMLLMKYAAPTLIEKQSGSVVVVASAAAYEPTAGNSAYVSSKYAVAGLTKCVALELGSNGIHVNYVCPGPVDTPMMLRIEKDFFGDTMTHEEAMAMLAEPTPWINATPSRKRWQTPCCICPARSLRTPRVWACMWTARSPRRTDRYANRFQTVLP